MEMKQKFTGLLKNLFGLCLMVSVLVGAIVAVIYVIGFIIGGSTGGQMAIFGSQIMKKAITVSAVGSLIGMLAFYVEGTHELKMDNKSNDEDEDEDSKSSISGTATSAKM